MWARLGQTVRQCQDLTMGDKGGVERCRTRGRSFGVAIICYIIHTHTSHIHMSTRLTLLVRNKW